MTDWERGNAYFVRSGEFFISKASVAGVPRYSLWQRPFVLHATYDTAREAKAHAERLMGVGADSSGGG
jgi:hypothetical protein